jgi:hypothetical protein
MAYTVIILVFVVIALVSMNAFKDIQIEKLNSELKQKDNYIIELTKKLHDLVS